MDTDRANCVVATIKRWNIEKFHELKRTLTNVNWILIDNPTDLNVDVLTVLKPDYIFFPHWSWLVPKEIYEKYECVVFHPADLPQGRGSSIFQHYISQGIDRTKVSAIRVAKGIDTGDIYMKRDFCLNGNGEEIYIRLADLIFDEMIPFIVKNRPQPIPQEGEPTVYKRRTPDMSKMPEDLTLKQAFDFIRMLDADTYPPAFIEVGNLRIEFTRPSLKTGEIIADARISISGTPR